MQFDKQHAKIDSLHGLRGIMSWWVVLGHVSLGLGWGLPLIDQNSLAVDVFVILSGFVITLLLRRKAEPYFPYLLRRGMRLWPAYAVALLISATLLQVQLSAWQTLPPHPTNLGRITLAQEALDNLFIHLGLHIPLVHGLVPRFLSPHTPYTIIGQSWSISLEWQFYVVAPFIVTWVADRRWALVAIASILLILVSPYFSAGFLGSKLPLFLIGITSYLIVFEAAGASLIALLIASAAFTVFDDGLDQLIPLGIWGGTLWSAMMPERSRGHSVAKLLGSRPLYYLGEISYSVYVLHMIPFYTSVFICSSLALPAVLTAAIVLVCTTTITFGAAILSYVYIEKPANEIAKRWATKLRTGSPIGA